MAAAVAAIASGEAQAACLDGPRAAAGAGDNCTGTLTSYTHDSLSPISAGQNGSMTLTQGSVTSASTGLVGKSVRADGGVITFQGDAIVTYLGGTNPNNTLLEAHLPGAEILVLGDITGLSDIRNGDAARAGSGAVIDIRGDASFTVRGDGVFSATRNAFRGSDPEGSSMILFGGDLSVASGGDALRAQGALGNGIIATGDQVTLTTTLNTGHGVSAFDGGKVFIQAAGGTVTADDDSLIVLDNANALIETEGDGAHGLIARSDTGDAHVEMSAGRVVTGANGGSGADSEGVFALVRGGTGEASILFNGGEVETFGEDADGLVANVSDGSLFSGINGDSTVVMTGGAVTTHGDGSAGLIAQSDFSAFSPSTGAVSVTQSGGVITTSGDALNAFQGSHGVLALSYGSGPAAFTQTGGEIAASGADADGAYVVSAYGETTVAQGEDGRIEASGADASGVRVQAGTSFDVDIAGAVTGGTGAGAGVETSGVSGTLDIAGTAAVSAGSGVAILNDSGVIAITSSGAIDGDVRTMGGDDSLSLTGGSLAGDVDMGLGSDNVTVAGAVDIGASTFDGGDDADVADLMEDVLTFSGGTRAIDGAFLTNWERVTLTDGVDFRLSGELATGAGAGLSGAPLGLSVEPGATLRVSGGAATVRGDLRNRGAVDMRDGLAGDRLRVSGNYAGGGLLATDAVLFDDASASDVLVVDGDTSGATRLIVNKVGGAGAPTVNGIPVVQVGGASTGTFNLANRDVTTPQGDAALVAGAFAYRLEKTADGDWRLVSSLRPTPPVPVIPIDPVDPVVTPEAIPEAPGGAPNPPEAAPLYQPAAPVYEAYPAALSALNDLPTLYQRVGNRYWPLVGRGTPAETAGGLAIRPREMTWARIEGEYWDFEPRDSTTSTHYDIHKWKTQLGVDLLATETLDGLLILGVNGYAGAAGLNLGSPFGGGSIDTEGYGLGLTATWYHESGFYADLQGQVGWFRSDLSSDVVGRVASNNDGQGYAGSIEVGRRIQGGGGVWSFTPQAQLTYAAVRFDGFTGPFGEWVTEGSTDSLELRLGASADREVSWTDGNGAESRSHVYSIANLRTELLGGRSVEVSGARLTSKTDRAWVELGAGANYSWGDDAYAVYGEVSGSTSVENPFDSYGLQGTVGFRISF